MTTSVEDKIAETKSELITLDITGMTCAACAARIEKKLNKLPGVKAAVNYATAQACVVGECGVDEMIAAVEKAGYGASPATPDSMQDIGASDEERQSLKNRVLVSAILSVPVIVVSMIPAWQFPGWQWVSFALATVVVFACGLSFHVTAVRNLRRGATTMDTLISLGTLSAYLWSAWAMIWGNAGQIGLTHRFHWALMRSDASANIYFEAACGIITFILMGRYVEARSKRQAG